MQNKKNDSSIYELLKVVGIVFYSSYFFISIVAKYNYDNLIDAIEEIRNEIRSDLQVDKNKTNVPISDGGENLFKKIKKN